MDKKTHKFKITMSTLFFSVFMLMTAGCNDKLYTESRNAGYCSAKLGCLNEKFIAGVESKCRDLPCKLSFEDILGDLDKVYFVERLGASLDECAVIPVGNVIKRTSTLFCQYILFEKDGQIKSFLRGYCSSDQKIIPIKDELGFNPDKVRGFVSVMDPSTSFVVRKITGEGIYYVDPAADTLVMFDPDRDKCVNTH